MWRWIDWRKRKRPGYYHTLTLHQVCSKISLTPVLVGAHRL